MSKRTLAALLAVLATAAPAGAADDTIIQRLSLCQDSWLDWTKGDPGKIKTFRDHFQAAFKPDASGGYFVPKGAATVAGLPLLQVYPQSVGMGVGFSVLLAAPFDATRAAIAKALGKPLAKCETGDGMRSCELEIAPTRTLTVTTDDPPKSKTTLVGCYYYYEK